MITCKYAKQYNSKTSLYQYDFKELIGSTNWDHYQKCNNIEYKMKYVVYIFVYVYMYVSIWTKFRCDCVGVFGVMFQSNLEFHINNSQNMDLH